MPKSRIPSPSRSQGTVTPRRDRLRRTRSVASPALSTTSSRLTSIIEQCEKNNMDSFALSPMNTQSVLTDNTDIEEPARKSWWKKINDSSRDIVEILEDNKAVGDNCVIEELYDIEVLRQEKQNYTLDLPESSDSESIKSIVLPQKKLFAQKENQPATKFAQLVSSRKSLLRRNSTNTNHDQTLKAGTKKLFQGTLRSKPVFPTGLLNITSTTIADKTNEQLEEPNKAVKNIFKNQPTNKRKNMFMCMNFIVSDSEEEIPEIQPKLFAFRNKAGQPSPGIRASDVTSDMEMDSWTHLPSSTMVDHQSDGICRETPIKKARLETQEKESNSSRKNKFAEFEEYIGDENSSSNEEIIDKDMLECQEIPASTKIKNITNLREPSKDSDSMFKEKQGTVLDTNSNEEKEIDQDNNNDINVKHNAAIKKINEEHERNNFTVRNNNENSKINGEANNVDNSQTKDVKSAKNDKQDGINQSQVIIEKENIEGNIKDEKQRIDNEQEKQEIVVKNIEEEIVIKEKTVNSKEKLDNIQQISETVKNNIDRDQDDIVVDKQNDVYEASRSRDSGDNNNENEYKENENQNKSNNKSTKNVDISSEIKNDISVIENQVDDFNDPDNKENDQEMTDGNDAWIESQVNDVNESDNNKEMDQEMSDVDDAWNESQDDGDEPNKNDEIDEGISNNDDTLNKNQVDGFDELDKNEEIDRNIVNSEKAWNEGQIETVDEPDNDNDNDQEVATNNDVLNKSHVENVDEPDIDEEEIAGSIDDIDEQEIADVSNQSQVEDMNKPDNDEESDQEMLGSGECQTEDIEESDNDEETHEEVVDSDDSDRALSNENAELDDDEVEVDKENEEDDYLELKYDSDVEEDGKYKKSAEIIEEVEETSNTIHNTTDNNKNNLIDKAPEAILRKQSRDVNSFTNYDHNISAGKTMMKSLNIRPSMPQPRDTLAISDDTKNSTAEGSGWDSHRTTRKTLRQTFGKDFTLRKSLRTLVMEKSAKRQTEQVQHSETVKLPQANSTELPDFSNRDVDDAIESDHEISRGTQQATLETYLEKIKQENMEKRLKIEEKVRNSLKAPSRYTFNFLKVTKRQPMPSQNKPKKQIKSVIPIEDLPPELVLDMMYKPPKKFKPPNASWITKRLYKFLETKLEPKYDYKARLRAENLMETIYSYVKELRRVKVASRDTTDALKHEMARLGVVTTHFEFYEFFNEYMPREVRVKVIPDIVNQIPLPREGVFAAILPGNT